MKYNLHKLKHTDHKYTVQYDLANVCNCVTHTYINSHPQKVPSCHFPVTSHLQPFFCFYQSILVLTWLGALSQWSHVVHILVLGYFSLTSDLWDLRSIFSSLLNLHVHIPWALQNLRLYSHKAWNFEIQKLFLWSLALTKFHLFKQGKFKNQEIWMEFANSSKNYSITELRAESGFHCRALWPWSICS